MAVCDAHVFPGFLTPVLPQLFFPKPPTTFLTCFCGDDRRKYSEKQARFRRGSNSQPPGHESDTLTTEPHGRGRALRRCIKNIYCQGIANFFFVVGNPTDTEEVTATEEVKDCFERETFIALTAVSCRFHTIYARFSKYLTFYRRSLGFRPVSSVYIAKMFSIYSKNRPISSVGRA